NLKATGAFSGVILVHYGTEIPMIEVIQPSLGVSQKAFNKDTPFNILSIGKIFTAIAIMQLIEGNVISLDDPITTEGYLKESDFILEGSHDTYRKDRLADKDIKQLKESKEPVTIRHLLTHTAGIRDPGRGKLRGFHENTIGTFAYSNYGYQLLARIV